jgi:methyl-accepting chemotaxis protein
MTRHKRRNFFIKKDFQGKLILGYFLLVICSCLFFFTLLGVFSADSVTITYSNNDLQVTQTPLMLLKKAVGTYWVFIVVGSVGVVLAAMLITHRIAGPIYRFEKTFDEMLSGNLGTRIKLRPKDEGKILADKINQFNSDLSRSFRTLQQNTRALEELLDDTQKTTTSISGDKIEELQGLVRSMQEKNRQIRSVCSAYVLRND